MISRPAIVDTGWTVHSSADSTEETATERDSAGSGGNRSETQKVENIAQDEALH